MCSAATFDSEHIEAKHLFENIWRISDFQGVYKPCFLEKTIEVEGSTDVETGTGKSKIRVFWPSFWIEASSLSSNCFANLSDVKYIKPHHSAANPRLMNVMWNEKWKWEEDQNENLIQSQTILWTDRRKSCKCACLHFAHYQYEHAIPHNNAIWYHAIPQCTIALDGSLFSGLGNMATIAIAFASNNIS